jgi:RNA polymerase sigma-70 factor (ECF subfamily)
MQQLEKGHYSSIEDTFYEEHAARLFAYIYRQLPSQQDAEDVMTEVFLAALKNGKVVTLLPEQQIAWLRRVAHNKIIDSYRRKPKLPPMTLEEALDTFDKQLTPEERYLQRERYERLYKALAQLSPVQQQVLRLRFGNDMRFKEIGELVNKSEATVRNMVMRTLRRLRAIVEG